LLVLSRAGSRRKILTSSLFLNEVEVACTILKNFLFSIEVEGSVVEIYLCSAFWAGNLNPNHCAMMPQTTLECVQSATMCK
jgi:hypothetical protein